MIISQDLLKLKAEAEAARAAYFGLKALPDGSPIEEQVKWDILIKSLCKASVKARMAYDAALEEEIGQ